MPAGNLPTPTPAPAAPWYTSKVQIAQVVTLLSALTAIAPKVAATLGLTNLENIQTTVEAIFGTIAFLAPLLGTFFRAKSQLQPLTLTKAKADAQPANIAAAANSLAPTGALNALNTQNSTSAPLGTTQAAAPVPGTSGAGTASPHD